MKSKTLKRLATLFVAGTMFVCLPMTALADTYSVSEGDVLVEAMLVNGEVKYNVTVNYVDQGAPSDNKVIITGDNKRPNGTQVNSRCSRIVRIISNSGANAQVTLSNLDINNRSNSFFAFSTEGEGTVTIELDGDNCLIGGSDNAGLYKENAGELIIKDDNNVDGKLEAIGGFKSAGIGCDYYSRLNSASRSGNNIIIEGGTVIAKGGENAAGIGGAEGGSGENITIKGGNVTAIGGENAAGIGGGIGGSGSVTISGGTVEATGGFWGAGIGGGKNGSGSVTVSGGNVTAIGGIHGAGIGGGYEGSGTVTISGGTVVATSEAFGAGIGGGSVSNGSTITVSGSANVSAMGGIELSTFGPGAAIGEGGKWDAHYDPVQGAAVDPDVSGLYTTGSITTYAVGTDIESIKQGTASGNTIVGTVPDPNTNTNTTTPEEPKVNEPKAEEPKKEEPKGEEPKIEEPPVYTERSCIADVDVAALVGALLSSNASATTLDIDFEDNICLNPEIMTALFADNRVSKNCYFWHEGKRYVLHIGPVNKQSPLYTSDFEMLKLEPDGLAGFKKMALIFANLGVTLDEVK